MNRFPIQPAKVQRPPLPDGTLKRDRLLDWLSVKIHSRVVLVIAEAGYGKTTTLSDFARRSRLRTIWYRLDEDDSNWVSFLNYLVAAGREREPEFAPATAALLADLGTSGATREMVTETFFHELPTLVSGSPAALILDDFHLVDESADVRQLMRELVARGPERLAIVLSSRRRPSLPLARLRARGEIAELSTDDLRFDLGETEQLFRETYRRPLETDVLTELNRRTDGWAASLQLVQTALRGRTAAETRAFVRSLSSAEGALYDYLAEEVVGDLASDLQQFLMRTSLLQVVDLELAGLTSESDEATTRRLMDASERLGLLSRRGDVRDATRYHPLVRDFLESRLRRDHGDDLAVALHRRVAEFAEPTTWRLAAYHYAAINAANDLRRILIGATQRIMGTGEFALAESYVDRLRPTTSEPEFEIIASRMELTRGRMDVALSTARDAWRSASTANSRVSSLANLVTIEYFAGNARRSLNLAQELAELPAPPEIADVARAFLSMSRATVDLNLEGFARELGELADRQRDLGLDRYFGITMLNLANTWRAMGSATSCLEASENSIDALTRSGSTLDVGSARSMRAWALMHLGREGEALAEMERAISGSHLLTRLEVLRESAETLSLYSDVVRAQALLEEARLIDPNRLETDPSPEQEILLLALAQNLARLGREAEARQYFERLTPDSPTFEQAYRARVLTASAELAASAGDDAAFELASSAVVMSREQGAHLYAQLASCVAAVSRPTAEMNARLAQIARHEPVYLTMEAGILAQRLADLDPAVLDAVIAQARLRPTKWQLPLRLLLADGPRRGRAIAGEILDEIGDESDIKLLREAARRARRDPEFQRLGQGLARRLAAHVVVEDLGRVTVRVGNRVIAGTSIRRKSLALLCFLVATPSMSATRDQVLDALWPEIEPSAALNSLNQTVYFLRRVFEPDFAEDRSPGYLHHDSDVLWLDANLVASQSSVCRSILTKIGAEPRLPDVHALVEHYVAPFALDFTYEDWTEPYRSNLHAAFLEAIEKAVASGLADGEFGEAISVARKALEVDRDADQIELSLLRLYRRTGAHAAAEEQYGHYAQVLRSELGVEPPALDSL